MTKTYIIEHEQAMLDFAQQFSQRIKPGQTIHLIGNLGAGKTTFVRGILRALGHYGAVKSPTFTIVEPYQINQLMLYHFDLYRIEDPEELELIGMRDYMHKNSLCFIEWPEKADGYLPKPDITCYIDIQGNGRVIKVDE
tara:strand:- start:238 stop:654 length:417 start_codon:yes stop_codon:yes gene_type:complete